MTISLNVSTEAQLRAALFITNDFASGALSDDYVINIGADFTGANALTRSLPMIRGDGTHTITINGNGHTIDGNDLHRVFFIESGKVAINDVTIANAKAQGGNGGDANSTGGGGGGGGGLGAGGAVFVNDRAVVTLTGVTVADAASVGGRGGNGISGGDGVNGNGSGGGGGLGGDGGDSFGTGGGGGGGYEGAGGAGDSFGGGGGGGEFGSGGVGAFGAGGGGGGQQGEGGVRWRQCWCRRRRRDGERQRWAARRR